MKIISIKDLSVKYGNFYALKDINLEVEEGEIIGVLGQSGSGKTTLCKIISGIEKPTEGSLTIKKFEKTKLQFVFQDPSSSLNPRMRIRDIIAEPLIISGEKRTEVLEEKTENVVKKVGLPIEIKTKYPHQLSGGQKQRVAIARAVITEPELLICDEPISSLDISVSAQILNLLKDLWEEKKFTMIFVSHDISSIYYLAHKTIILYRGNLMEWGDTDEIIKKPAHPYTKILISSILSTDSEKKNLKIKERESYSKCVFSGVCPEYEKLCEDYRNEIVKINENHFFKCGR